MKTENEKLVVMANQIADFFRPYPPKEAIAGIQAHIASFWTASMRAKIAARAMAGDPHIDPLVLQAVRTPARQGSPIRKETGGPEVAGQMESDAG